MTLLFNRRLACCVAVMVWAGSMTPAPAWAQDPVIGPRVRVDLGGGTSAANETTAAASEADPNVIVAGWNDYRLNAWRSGFSLSFDGGETWSDFLLRPPRDNQTSVEGDPMTAYDKRTGTLWAGAMSFTGGNGGIYVARLDPGQKEFNPPVMADTDGGVDKGWMTTGPIPGNPDSTRLYIAYNLGIIWSDDMGDTWTNPFSFGWGLGFLPRVGPNGEVYVAYWDFVNGGDMRLKRSLNGGASFTTHTIAVRMDSWNPSEGLRFPGRFRVPIYIHLDVSRNTGKLYAVYFDTTDVRENGRNVDLYFTTSADQGTTWTTPVVINGDNDPPGDQFFSWIELDERDRIHIVFLDSRHTVQNDNVNDGMFDAYYTYSDDDGATWHEFRLTPESWNSDDDGLNRQNGVQFLGDYMGMAVAGNRVYPVYLDTTGGDPNIYTNVITFPDGCDGCDTNCDGDINAFDIEPFLDLLFDPNAKPCNTCTGDANGDGSIDAFDIEPFLECLFP